MISFIVPVKNGLDYTRGFVRSVIATNPDTEIEWVIVDSGSTDGTLEFCREIGAIVVAFPQEPFNYCAAINAGAEHASGDLWVIANNDLEFRSQGDLARLERLFQEWSILAVVSPGRPVGEAEIEFRPEGINGATWAVRPRAFRNWGGMPEGMSGYGYDELYTAVMCWRHGWANAWLTGWDVHHFGSATFGPLGGNVTPALRRNLSRLLAALDASALDHPHHSPDRILDALRTQERQRAPARLECVDIYLDGPVRETYVNVKVLPTNSVEPSTLPRVLQSAESRDDQWLPWLANELLLQPDAAVVGELGCFAVRVGRMDPDLLLPLIEASRRVGPPPPPLLPPIPGKRPTLRQKVAAWLHDRRNKAKPLPDEW